ncbi:hypothetical protein Bbelb_243550 [Branchiostoma belcheri]|nr:hypothetical protein Bbelb_243550 [Branchiostoma belcheri]
MFTTPRSSDLQLVIDDLEMETEAESTSGGELQGRNYKDNRVAPAVLDSSKDAGQWLPQNGPLSAPAKTSAVASDNGDHHSGVENGSVPSNSDVRHDHTHRRRMDGGELQRVSIVMSNQVPDDKAMEDDVRNFLKWLIPYYFAVSAPVLIGLRLYLYWAAPAEPRVFQIVFAIANGPLVIAVFFFRNSIVFHSIDRMTSVFIHSLPAYVTYGVRWYSPQISVNWYTPFPGETEFQDPSFIWLLAVPLACYVGHALLYAVVVNGILRPSPAYWNSYRFFTAKKNSVWYKVLNIFSYFNYNILNVLICLASMLLCQVWYRWFIAHAVSTVVAFRSGRRHFRATELQFRISAACSGLPGVLGMCESHSVVFLAVAFVIKAWNGATFYMDVFRLGKGGSDWD